MSKRKRRRPPPPPELHNDPWHDITLVCRCCGNETGEKHTVRESNVDPSILTGDKRMRHGICDTCMEWVKKGHTIIIGEPDDPKDDRPSRSAILTLEGTATLTEDARGIILRVPLDEWLKRFPTN